MEYSDNNSKNENKLGTEQNINNISSSFNSPSKERLDSDQPKFQNTSILKNQFSPPHMDISKLDNASNNNVEHYLAQNSKFKEIFEQLERGSPTSEDNLEERIGMVPQLGPSEFSYCVNNKEKYEMLQKMLLKTFGPFVNTDYLFSERKSLLKPVASLIGTSRMNCTIREKLDDVTTELSNLKKVLQEERKRHEERNTSHSAIKSRFSHDYDQDEMYKPTISSEPMSVYSNLFLLKHCGKSNYYTKQLESEIRGKRNYSFLDDDLKSLYPIESQNKNEIKFSDKSTQPNYLAKLLSTLQENKKKVLVSKSSYPSIRLNSNGVSFN